jgi:hypothetical protein
MPRPVSRYILDAMRVGIAHHLGWAVAVTASADHQVVDRRRIKLIEPGVAAAPIHHEGKPLDDAAISELVAHVRASAVRAESASLGELPSTLSEPLAVRRWYGSASNAWPSTGCFLGGLPRGWEGSAIPS